MKYKDYYKILGLDTTRVTVEEIKSAYRAAVKRNHPDLNVDDNLAEEKIKDINEAYKTLSIPASKRKYDRIWNSRNNANNYQKFKGKNIFNMFLGDIPPNTEVMNDLAQSDFKGINAYNPIRTNKYDEVFNYNAETRKIMANYWAKVKIAASNAKSE